MYSWVLHSLPNFAFIAAQLVSLQVLIPPADVPVGVGVADVSVPEPDAVTVGFSMRLVVVSFEAFVVKLQGTPSLLNSLSAPRT